jgi:hypothetical protein
MYCNFWKQMSSKFHENQINATDFITIDYERKTIIILWYNFYGRYNCFMAIVTCLFRELLNTNQEWLKKYSPDSWSRNVNLKQILSVTNDKVRKQTKKEFYYLCLKVSMRVVA